MQLSHGANTFDTKWVDGIRRHEPIMSIECTWEELAGLCLDAANVARDDKDQTPWIAPFVLRPDTDRRRLEDVERMSAWIGLDLDKGGWTLPMLESVVQDVAAIIYTTAGSRPDAQRWRILIQLDRDYSITEHDRIWRHLFERFSRDLDPACRNYNRIFYVPAQWDGADNVIVVKPGRPGSVDTILACTPPIATPPMPTYSGAPRQMITAPDGAPIITHGMLSRALAAPEGGRLYRLMCEASKRFRLNGWTLTSNALASAGHDAAQTFSPGKKRGNIDREAQRALTWAEQNFTPMTQMQKVRDRILWEKQRNERLINQIRK